MKVAFNVPWRRGTRSGPILATAILATATAVVARAETDVGKPVPLSETPHIHGIAVDPNAPSRLYLATPEGLYVATPDGMSTRVSEDAYDFRGFTIHPTDAGLLLASGRAPDDSNLGIVTSRDGGRNWRQLSPGLDGPVNFYATAISRADPRVIYGVFDAIHVSRDGGRTWRRAGPGPLDTIGLAASPVDADRLYAATMTGLAVSRDGGVSWKPVTEEGRPAATVQTAGDGTVYVYILGVGFMSAQEPGLSWTLLSKDTGDQRIRHLAPDPLDTARLYAVDFDGRVLESADGGRSWQAFPAGGGSRQ